MASSSSDSNTITTDDPLQAALLEAESLMESFGGIGIGDDLTNNNHGSFAIDSDEEIEDAATTGNTNNNNNNLHPLHDAFLLVKSPDNTNTTTTTSTTSIPTPSTTTSTATAAAMVSGYGQQYPNQQVVVASQLQQQQSQSSTSFSNVPTFFGTTTTSTVGGAVVDPTNTTATSMFGSPDSIFSSTSTTTNIGTTSGPPSLDVIKASTSRFASNLANMAQRAANQVVTGVTTATTTTVVNNTPTGSTNGGNQHQQQQYFFQQQQQQQQQQSYPSSMNYISPTGAGSNVITGQANMNMNHHQQQQLQQQQQQPELDAEQKAILVQSHVGKFISGERIIMFLQNIQHISDSTGIQYNNNNSGTDISASLWCCAVTFYRVLLFSTHPIQPIYKPNDWNASCWPGTMNTSSSTTNHASSSSSSSNILQIPLSNIDKIEKSVFTATTTSSGFGTMNIGTSSIPSSVSSSSSSMNTLSTTTIMGLILHDKLNGRQIRFTTMNYSDTNKLYDVLHTYSFPGRRNLGYLFAFESKREEVMASITTDTTTGNKQVTLSPTKKRFDAMYEYQRQFHNASIVQDQGPWTIWSTINSSYQLCMSYPSIIVGPISLDERLNPDKTRLIAHCASFRSEQRLPALTWCGYGGSSIWRCSQPKVGLQGNRSAPDEQYFKHIIECAAAARSIMNNSSTNTTNSIQQHQLPPRSVLIQLVGTSDLSNWMPNNVGLKILDLRPRSSAMANRTGGYGYENTSHYIGCSIQFCNIGNIHAVRDSYQKVSQLCLSTNSSDLHFVQQLEDTKWLSHIRVIWAAAWETAYWVHVHKLPVLVHCSHGWDRTSQVVALSQLLLDPYYRTMAGFSCLIEKDFMSFGHPFHLRCGHGEGKDGASNASSSNNNGGMGGGGPAIDEGQISPIFLQFLDCVYQVVRLYPEAFEFNTKYLLLLSEHIYSGRFGNFLCDTEREREVVAGLRQRTHSIWDYLDEQRSDVYNPLYCPTTHGAGVLLMPVATLLRNIVLWVDRHCMYSPKPFMRWLPSNIERPTHPLNNDQSSDLITEQETYQLLYTLPKQQQRIVTPSSSSVTPLTTNASSLNKTEEETIAPTVSTVAISNNRDGPSSTTPTTTVSLEVASS